MILKFSFKLTDIETETEFKAGDKVRLYLVNGEIVVGELKYSNSILLSIERNNASEEYDFGDIINMEHLSNISKHDECEIDCLINWKEQFTNMMIRSGLSEGND